MLARCRRPRGLFLLKTGRAPRCSALAVAALLVVGGPRFAMSDDAASLTEERAAALERKVTALESKRDDKVTMRTVRSHTSITPGQTFLVALDFRIRFGWHMYGAKPGSDYIPVRIQWGLPEGFTVKEVKWSKTEKESGSGKPIHRRRARAIAVVEAPAKLPEGEALELTPKVTWQVCKESCRVGSLTLPIKLDVGRSEPTIFAPLLEAGPDGR